MNNQFGGNMGNVPIVNTTETSKGLYIFIIVVLLLVSIGLGGYICYIKFFEKTEIEVSNTGEVLEQIQIDSEAIFDVGSSIANLENAFNDHSSGLFGYLYKSDLLKVDEFDYNNALFAAVYPYLEESNSVSFVSNNTVKTNFKKLFGSSLKYTPSNINGGEGYVLAFDGTYYAYNRVGNGGYFYPEYVTFYESSSISSEKIEVVKRVAYLEYSSDYTTIELYTDGSKKKLISQIPLSDGSYSVSELKAKYKSKFLKYKYTFVNDGRDKYIFDSIMRVS